MIFEKMHHKYYKWWYLLGFFPTGGRAKPNSGRAPPGHAHSWLRHYFHSNSIAPALEKFHRQSALLNTTFASIHTGLSSFIQCSDGPSNIFQVPSSLKKVGRMTLCARCRVMKTLSDFDGQVNSKFNQGFQSVFQTIDFNVRHQNLYIRDSWGRGYNFIDH